MKNDKTGSPEHPTGSVEGARTSGLEHGPSCCCCGCVQDRAIPVRRSDLEIVREALADILALRLNPYAMTPSREMEVTRGYLSGLVNAIVRRALAAVDRMQSDRRRDTARLDWLEGELEREQRTGLRPLFRGNVPITRATIDDAMQRAFAVQSPATLQEQRDSAQGGQPK